MNRLKLMECMYKTLCYWVFEKCSALLAPKTTKNLYTINVLESSGLELEILDNFEGLMANYYYEKID